MEEFEKLGEPQAELFPVAAKEPTDPVTEAAPEVAQPDESTG